MPSGWRHAGIRLNVFAVVGKTQSRDYNAIQVNGYSCVRVFGPAVPKRNNTVHTHTDTLVSHILQWTHNPVSVCAFIPRIEKLFFTLLLFTTHSRRRLVLCITCARSICMFFPRDGDTSSAPTLKGWNSVDLGIIYIYIYVRARHGHVCCKCTYIIIILLYGGTVSARCATDVSRRQHGVQWKKFRAHLGAISSIVVNGCGSIA